MDRLHSVGESFMTEGDRRAEAERAAKVCGPAYAQGQLAALREVRARITLSHGVLDSKHDHAVRVGMECALENIDELIAEIEAAS